MTMPLVLLIFTMTFEQGPLIQRARWAPELQPSGSPRATNV